MPIYNLYVLLQIAGRPGWWLILAFIPVLNLILLVLPFDIARKVTPVLLRRGRHLLTSIKSDLGQFRSYPRSRIPGVKSPIDAARCVFEEIIRTTKQHRPDLDIREAPVVITVPASSSGLARADLLDAAVAAGFKRERLELLDEPVAALIDLLNSADGGDLLSGESRNVLVFDFGAGTCDLALVRARFEQGAETGLEVETLAISPYRRLGGDDIDRALLTLLIPQAFADPGEWESLSGAKRRALADTLLPAVAQPLKEKACRAIAAFLAEHPSDGWDLLRKQPITVQHSLDRGFEHLAPGTRFSLSSAEFEGVMKPFVAWKTAAGSSGTLMQPVLATLEKAGLTMKELDVLVLHGGSSQNPHVRQLMAELLVGDGHCPQLRVTTTPDMLTSVAHGAAITCYWRHCRGKDFIHPVLGEDMGIVTSDDEHHVFVSARTPVPFPAEADAFADPTGGEERFFTPDGSADAVLVPFFVGSRKARRIAGSVRVTLPPGTPARAPLRVRFRIDHDKKIEWLTSVGDGPFVEAPTLHDPWTCGMSCRAERDLVAHRRTMAASIARGQEVSAWALHEEARLAWHAGRAEEALMLIDDALDESSDVAWAWCLKGMFLNHVGRRDEALEALRHATELDPRNSECWFQLGYALIDKRADHHAAEAALRQCLDLSPSRPLAHHCLGRIYRLRADEVTARAEFTRALALAEAALESSPFSRWTWDLVARLRREVGQYPESQAGFAMVQDLDTEARIDGRPSEWIQGARERRKA